MQYLTTRLTRAPEQLHLRLLLGLGAEAELRPPPPGRPPAWPGVAELDWTAGEDASAVAATLRERAEEASRALEEAQARAAPLSLRLPHPPSPAQEARVSARLLVHEAGEAGESGGGGRVSLSLRLSRSPPRLVGLEASRVAGAASGAAAALDAAVLDALASERVLALRLGEGCLALLFGRAWSSLASLRLQHLSLPALPDGILAGLPALSELWLDGCGLAALPSLAPLAATLRLLSADRNALAALPPALSACTRLQVLSLEHNKLTRPIVDLRPLSGTLRELRLAGNAIEYLPELSHCRALRSLSLVNARIVADAALSSVDVYELAEEAGGEAAAEAGAAAAAGGAGRDELAAAVASCGGARASYAPRAEAAALLSPPAPRAPPPAPPDYSALYALIFRFSSCQLPLLAAAVAVLAEQPAQAEAVGGAEGGIQQLLSMVLSDDHAAVVAPACRTLALLAASGPATAAKLLSARAPGRLLVLLSGSDEPPTAAAAAAAAPAAALAAPPSPARPLAAASQAPRPLSAVPQRSRVAALRCVAAVAWASHACALALGREPEMLAALYRCAASPAPPVQLAALEAVGNIGLSGEAAARLRALPGLVPLLCRLAGGPRAAGGEGPAPMSAQPACAVRRRAARALAVLGCNAAVAAALGRPACLTPRRGLRILAMDGGGMRGLCTVRMLRELERASGRRIADMFDLICGTSTGGVLAVALGLHRHDLDTCEALYRHLGSQVFSTRAAGPAAGGAGADGYMGRLGQLYGSASSRVRVAVSGCKHDAATFERLMREACAFAADAAEEREPALIDTAWRGGPAVFVVATLMNVQPAVPYIFRNYVHDASTAPPPPPQPPATLRGPSFSGGGSAAAAAAAVAAASPSRLSGDPLAPPVPGPIPAAPGPPLSAQLAALDGYCVDSAHAVAAPVGGCAQRVWQAVRASSAAPYYLADFSAGGLRWQDGALVANNPSLLALQEAGGRWPGTPVDVLVSLGTGSPPLRPRDASAISRYIDAGAVLVEAACDVQRTDDALRLLAPAAGLNYVRLSPTDERCAVELDELDEALLAGLESATEEYISRERERFARCAAALGAGLPPPPPPSRGAQAEAEEIQPPPPPVLAEAAARARAARRARAAAAAAAAAGASPPGSPRGGGAEAPLLELSSLLGSDPIQAGPPGLATAGARRRLGAAAARRGVAVLASPRGDEGEGGGHAAAVRAAATAADCASTFASVAGAEEAAAAAAAGLGCAEALHWAGHCGPGGLVAGWRRDVCAVAEPGDGAAAFLASLDEPGEVRNLRQLCASDAPFLAGGVLHWAAGEASHALPPPQGGPSVTPKPPPRAFAALFQRALPAAALGGDALAAAGGGAWRGALLVLARPAPTAVAAGEACAPELALAAAALDAGASAVLAPLRAAAAPAPSEGMLCAFFEAFYAAFCGAAEEGAGVTERAGAALEAAARAAPAAAAAFRLLTLREGHLVAAGAEGQEEWLPHPAAQRLPALALAPPASPLSPRVREASPPAAAAQPLSPPPASPRGEAAAASALETPAPAKRGITSLFW